MEVEKAERVALAACRVERAKNQLVTVGSLIELSAAPPQDTVKAVDEFLSSQHDYHLALSSLGEHEIAHPH